MLSTYLEGLEFDEGSVTLEEIHTFSIYSEHGRTFAICLECDCSFSITLAHKDYRDYFTLEQLTGGDPLLCEGEN